MLVTRVSHIIVLSTTSRKFKKNENVPLLSEFMIDHSVLGILQVRAAVCDHAIYNDFSQLHS